MGDSLRNEPWWDNAEDDTLWLPLPPLQLGVGQDYATQTSLIQTLNLEQRMHTQVMGTGTSFWRDSNMEHLGQQEPVAPLVTPISHTRDTGGEERPACEA